MTRLLLAFSLLLPAWAMAQSLTVNSNSVSTVTFGSGNCLAHVTATYTLAPASVTYCNNLIYFYGSASSSCNGTDGGTLAQITPSTAGATGTIDVPLSSLPGLDSTSCNAAGGVNVTAYVCGFATYFNPLSFGSSCSNNSATPLGTNPPLTILYQGKAPDAPSIGSSGVDELDGELDVNLSTSLGFNISLDAGVGLSKATVYFSPASSDGGGLEQSKDSNNSRVVLTGLTNDVPYALSATVTDTAGNVSPRSNTVIHTPRATVGFFGAYKKANGATGGGCSSGGGAALLVAGLTLGWLLRRNV